MKTEVLKKQHYWIVAGVSLLMVLLAFFTLSAVSDAIETQNGEIKKAADSVKNVPAPGKVALMAIEEQKKTLEKKKDDLWKENWENQKAYFTWPKTPDNRFDKFNDLKFGTPFAFTDEMFPVIQKAEVYRKMYEDMAAAVAPTKFNNGWQSVLGERYIDKWGEKKPDPKQLWLAMEDVWVYRALLDPIRTINRSAAVFTLVEPAAGLLKRTFRSRIWQIELEVADLPPTSKVIKAKLKNLTNQMQLLGTGSALTLKIWIDANLDNPPLEFKVEGEFIPGETEIAVPQLPSHIIPPGVTVTELAKVEQVLDERTVPIRQIESVSLSQPSAKTLADLKAVSNDDFRSKLQPPEFWKEGAAPGTGDASTTTGAAASTTQSTGTTGSDRPAGGLRPGVRPGTRPGTLPGPGVPGTPAPGANASGGTNTLQESVDSKRLRYLEVTGQLRRMPVAVKLVLDLRYMQDVMVAYANSPLRLQIVQYHWARYRGTLMPSADPAGGSGGTGGFGSDSPATISGSIGADLRGPRGGLALDNGTRQGFIPGLTGGTLTSVSDAQANSALIELTIYGIVTLYEKHEVKTAATSPVATPVAPTPVAPPAKPAAPPATPPMPVTPASEKTPAEATPSPKGTPPVTPTPPSPPK